MRFDGKMVKKPWGVEYCAFDDGNVAIWYLHLRAGQKTSAHYHARKKTVLHILSGEATVRTPVRVGDSVVYPKDVHQTDALTDAWLMEVEIPSDKLDLVRVDDAYGRSGKPYENGEHLMEFDERYAYPSHEFPE